MLAGFAVIAVTGLICVVLVGSVKAKNLTIRKPYQRLSKFGSVVFPENIIVGDQAPHVEYFAVALFDGGNLGIWDKIGYDFVEDVRLVGSNNCKGLIIDVRKRISKILWNGF